MNVRPAWRLPEIVPVLFLALFLSGPVRADGGGRPGAQPPAGYAHSRPYAGEMIYDALIVRPLSIAAMAIGAGVFVVGLPFSALGGNVEEAAERLVNDPAYHAFRRCLGCFRQEQHDPAQARGTR